MGGSGGGWFRPADYAGRHRPAEGEFKGGREGPQSGRRRTVRSDASERQNDEQRNRPDQIPLSARGESDLICVACVSSRCARGRCRWCGGAAVCRVWADLPLAARGCSCTGRRHAAARCRRAQNHTRMSRHKWSTAGATAQTRLVLMPAPLWCVFLPLSPSSASPKSAANVPRSSLSLHSLSSTLRKSRGRTRST